MAEQDLDRSEAATPFKLEQARKRGQTSKSVDLTVAAVFLVLVCLFYGLGEGLIRRELVLCREVLSELGRGGWSSDATFGWLVGVFGRNLLILAPFLAALFIAAALATFLQVGGVFSAEPIKPNFDRLNLANGFKRLFSGRLLFETAKSVAKVLVLGGVLWLVLTAAFGAASSFPYLNARALLHWLYDQVGSVLVKLGMVLLVIGLIDLIYVRLEFGKKMRMSRREMRDEHKHREGDPRIRSRMRELRIQFLKRARSARNLPDADVLITNPTHVVVALAYKHGEMAAPKLLSKGAGEFAAKLKRTARRLGIPVVENPPLARQLFRQVDYDGYVPADLYPDVAKILVWVYAMRSARSAEAAR